MGKTKTITFKNSMFEAESATKVRTTELIPVMSGRTLTFDKTDNTVIAVYEYDESRTLLGLASEFRTDRTCTLRWNTCYILIMIKMNDGSNVSPTEVESKIGGGLSMCERLIEFGTSTNGNLYTKGRNFLNTKRIGVKLIDSANPDCYGTPSLATSGNNTLVEFEGIPVGYPNEIFTLSFEAKGTAEKLRVFFYGPSGFCPVKTIEMSEGTSVGGSDGRAEFIPTANWKKYWVRWTLQGTDGTTNFKHVLFRSDGSTQGRSLYIRNIKLEYGTEATPYSPAPEDFVNRTCAEYDLTV